MRSSVLLRRPRGGVFGGYTSAASSKATQAIAADVVFAVAYTLDASPASFAVSAFAASVLAGRALDAQAASVAVTGSAATVAHGFALDAQPASVVVTGAAAGIIADRALNAQPAPFALTGVAAGAYTDRVLNAQPASFALTGVAAGVFADRVLLADPASVAVTGFDAGLEFTPGAGAFELDAQPAVYVLTPFHAGLLTARILIASPASFAVAAIDVTLVFSGAGPAVPHDVAYETLRAWLIANWSATPLRFENENDDPPSDLGAFVFFEVWSEFVDVAEIGAGSPRAAVWREEGEAVFHILVASGSGPRTVRDYAEQLALKLRGLALPNGVRVGSLSIGMGEQLAGDGNYFDLPLSASWSRDNWALGSN